MKVLITGKNGYIAKNTYKLFNEKNVYADIVSVKGGIENIDFSKYDAVIHCAGLAHRKYEENEYFEVNRDLTKEIAEKAKKSGVRQFIFLSTISVFGKNSGVINKNTEENPVNFYGKSKCEADKILLKMANDDFKVVIARPPMVYGKGCRGNYARLAKLAKKVPFFFDSGNKRSMIYIENLAEFLYNAFINGYSGIFYPQNKEYVNTFDMVSEIGACWNKKIFKMPFGNIFGKIKKGIIEKVFGTLIIDRELEKNNFDYCICGFEESIKRTESV